MVLRRVEAHPRFRETLHRSGPSVITPNLSISLPVPHQTHVSAFRFISRIYQSQTAVIITKIAPPFRQKKTRTTQSSRAREITFGICIIFTPPCYHPCPSLSCTSHPPCCTLCMYHHPHFLSILDSTLCQPPYSINSIRGRHRPSSYLSMCILRLCTYLSKKKDVP